jgi:hypothetical protein
MPTIDMEIASNALDEDLPDFLHWLKFFFILFLFLRLISKKFKGCL